MMHITKGIKSFLTDLAIGILGLFVGIDNLLSWNGYPGTDHQIIVGLVCTILATGWLIYVLFFSISK